MGRCTKAFGKMISSMESGLRRGWIAPSTRETIATAASMVWAPTNGMTAQDTKESGLKTKSLVWEFTPGSMADRTKASGKTTTWKELASISGTMAAATQENTSTTKSMGMASTGGRTEGSTKGTGTSANSMAWAFILLHLRIERNTVSGKKASELNGSKLKHKILSTRCSWITPNSSKTPKAARKICLKVVLLTSQKPSIRVLMG
jgi:hypothetical protein